MHPLPDERSRLDSIAGFLRAEDPGLAALFDMFTRLVRDEGKPPAERQILAVRPWRERALVARRAGRGCRLAYTVLTALFISAIILLGLS